MGKNAFYFSLQFSAIQKTVLRHDRLWSMAGISQILSMINELELPRITQGNDGDVLVAGGGKFTAKFPDEQKAQNAADEMVKAVTTTLPMLEFQYSPIIEAGSLVQAKDTGLIKILLEQKQQFRGYGITYNPHLEVCDECGEYPAVETSYQGNEKSSLCRICFQARKATSDLKNILSRYNQNKTLTSLERIYARYWARLSRKDKQLQVPSIPKDFEKIFPRAKENKEKKNKETEADHDAKERVRMAVWLSDANNMNGKVPVWLSQDDDLIPKIFKQVQEVNIKVVSGALETVFGPETWNEHDDGLFLPFRLVVAGGDDLCLVMPEEYILDFTLHFSNKVSEAVGGLQEDHFLHESWLESHRDPEKQKDPPGPYCFGASFVVTALHTPFKAIHSLGETLMSTAKEVTKREADSVNWQILNVDEEADDAALLIFEKPVFIQNKQNSGEHRSAIADRHTFERYLDSMRDYLEILSSSQMKNAASALVAANGDSAKAELILVKSAVGVKKEGLTKLLSDKSLRTNEGHGKPRLDLPKIATLLELINIKRREKAK